MKYLTYIIAIIALVFTLSSCEERNIKESKLPTQSREFISAYFPGVGFMHAEKEKDDGVTTYDVALDNGVELAFAESGEWISVDCQFTVMPEGIVLLLPEKLNAYLAEKHTASKIVSIDKYMGGYEISLNNLQSDLLFTGDGTFVRYDM